MKNGKLRAWVESVSGVEAARLVSARLPKGKTISPSSVSRLLAGTRRASLEVAQAFEDASQGQVRVADMPLSPDDRRWLRRRERAA